MNIIQVKMEKFFFALLIFNPFFDLIGGIYIYINYESIVNGFMPLVSPALYIRMAILVLFIIYILIIKDKQSIFVIIPIGIAWAFTVAGEFLFAADFSLLADMKYTAKFVFNIAVILVYWRVFQKSGLSKDELFDKINWILAFTSLWIASIIIICSIANIGFTIHEYFISFSIVGSRGFFYSGNDLVGILMLLFPLTIAFYLKMQNGLSRAKKLFWLIAPAMLLSGLLQIGTKTTFIAVICTIVGMSIYVIISRIIQKNTLMLKRMAMILLNAVVINIMIISIDMLTPVQSTTLMPVRSIAQISDQTPAIASVEFTTLTSDVFIKEEIREAENTVMVIQEGSREEDNALEFLFFSGRLDRLEPIFQQFNEGGLYAFLFGIGRGTQERTIEMDFFECIIYYGIIGAIAMLWLYVKLGIRLTKNFFKKADATGLALLISLGLTTGYLIVAGHVLFSASAGFYFAFVILYSAIYYADDPKSANIINMNKKS